MGGCKSCNGGLQKRFPGLGGAARAPSSPKTAPVPELSARLGLGLSLENGTVLWFIPGKQDCPELSAQLNAGPGLLGSAPGAPFCASGSTGCQTHPFPCLPWGGAEGPCSWPGSPGILVATERSGMSLLLCLGGVPVPGLPAALLLDTYVG